MVATASTMRDLGTPMPRFELVDEVSGEPINNECYAGRAVLAMFICNHCPFVVHIAQQMADVANRLQSQGLAVIAVSSNDIDNYPQDAPHLMIEFAKQYGFEFPYCFDETQQVAKAFDAACTPDFFIFDAQHELSYRGQFDDSRPSNDVQVTGGHLLPAAKAVLNGEAVPSEQVPSIGCNIKWK